MNTRKYTPAEYRTMLRMSHKKYLLVEGKNDKRLFQILLHELFSKFDQGISSESINIDSAENLIQGDASFSNRQKVEQVCSSVQKTPLTNKLIGFVDREFREFDRSEVLRDKLNKHNIIDGVVWSRGHSIENYCFDFFTLHDPLREHSDIDHFAQALDRFKGIFDATLRLACAVSLAAEELDKLKRIEKSINWEIVEITNSEVSINFDVFKRKLIDIHKFTEEEYNMFTEYFCKWLERVEKSEMPSIKWLCHGHIGFKFIWSVYGKCVYEICKNAGLEHPESETHKVLEAKESGRLRTCGSSWIRMALNGLSEYPKEVLIFLDLTIS